MPERVLDEYDGPRLFTLRSDDDYLLLAYQCAEDDQLERFLVVPVDDGLVHEIEEDRVTLRDALLGRGWAWLVDRQRDGSITGPASVDPGLLPASALPKEGARLNSHAQPLLRLKMVGETLTSKWVPASVVERAVKGATGAVRILARHVLQKTPSTGRPAESFRRYYDLPATGFALSSFEIEFGAPTPAAQLQLGFEDAETLRSVQELLLQGLRWATSPGTTELPQTAEASAIVEALAQLAPPQKGVVARVEISGALVRDPQSPLCLTRASSERIGNARKRLSMGRNSRTYEGLVREFDKDKLTFILRKASGDTVRTVSFSEEQYEDVWLAFDTERPVTIVADEFPGTQASELISVTFIAPDDSRGTGAVEDVQQQT